MITKNRIIAIQAVIIIAIAVAGYFLIDSYYSRAKRAEHNLSLSESQWLDERKRFISEVEQSTVTQSNMRKIFRKDSARMVTTYEKRIYEMKRELNDLGIKYTNLLEYTTGTMTVVDSFAIKFVYRDTTLTATHSDGYITQRFSLDKNYVMRSDYSYRDTIHVTDVRRPKLKENGKKHWPNWGRLPWVGWDEQVLIYSNNPKAKFTGVYSIKIER